MSVASHELGDFTMPEAEHEKKEQDVTIEVKVIAPNGFGFGEGKISTETQLKNPELSGLTPEAMEKGLEIIKSGKPFVPVDADAKDDGCGDGRPTSVIYKMVDSTKKIFKKSRRRAKVFGGGLIAASSMFRAAIRGNVQPGDTVLGDREATAAILDKRNVEYGGHTDNHAHGEKCGCGAIDLYPEITANALKYRTEITNLVTTVYRDVQGVEAEALEAKTAAIERVFAVYENQVENAPEFFKNAAGSKTMELMERKGSVIKELADDHLEDFVVVNDIEGTTFDQRMFDEEMIAHGVEGTAQAFVVDAWRGRMYADLIADEAHKEHGIDRQHAYDTAEADFWIRTLAVSGTLTAGDLPAVYRGRFVLVA